MQACAACQAGQDVSYIQGGVWSSKGSPLLQGLDEELVATIGLDVLRALEYMHLRGRIHRDVKARPSALCTPGLCEWQMSLSGMECTQCTRGFAGAHESEGDSMHS